MYVVFVSKDLNVKQLSEIWGECHETVRNGELQSIHILLKQHPEWNKVIRSQNIPRNARVLKLNNVTRDDLMALAFSGIMVDEGFQIIGYIEDTDINTMVTAFKKAQLQTIDNILASIRNEAIASLEQTGVYDAISLDRNKVAINISAKSAIDVRQTIQTKKGITQQYMLAEIPELASFFHQVG